MKVRRDFVTNSSSSSFIIGKKDDEFITIESVYQVIKGFYREYLAKRDALVEYITANPKLNLEYVLSEDGYYGFKCIKGEKWDKKNYAIGKAIERDFGISIWDYFDKEYEWLECDTYIEYEKYWLEKMRKAKDYSVHAPFTLADFFEEKKVKWLHYYLGNKEEKLHRVNSSSYILGWYFEYVEEAFKNMESCKKCSCSSWCDKKECEHQKELIKDIPEEQACLYLLGRICVHSESGYLPDYVVEKLREISEYSCDHMG